MLLLKIISKDRYLCERTAHRFGVEGGTVGRGSHCDWVIDDPSRFLSSVHMRINFRDGAFRVTDLSMNGTYLGRRRLPRGVEDDQPLSDGDELTLGDIKIKASFSMAEHSFSVTQMTSPLQQQAVDAISVRYPDLDHGAQFRALRPKEDIVTGAVTSEPVHALKMVITQVLVEVQKQRAADRITDPVHFGQIPADNCFCKAGGTDDIFNETISLDQLKQDLVQALSYLKTAPE